MATGPSAPSALVIATSNAGKVREFHRLLGELECVGLDAFPAFEGAVEDGDTFEANAVKKARHAATALGRACLADDSGLCVPALGGAPGVRSARYAGEAASDAENVAKLLAALEGKARDAYFACVLALATPAGELWTAEGRVHGQIAAAPRGEGGFGYDPVFVADAHRRHDSVQTFAEVRPAQKNAISHRADAVKRLLERVDPSAL
ncbi:MAG: RdgB/HAM1 family non-canonical purine NTP pyrophosphatase [Myxococcota bacterium]